MQFCNVTHCPGVPALHCPIVALHCSVLTPTVRLLCYRIMGIIISVSEDGVYTGMISCVSHYTALSSVLKFPNFCFIQLMDKAQITDECNLFTAVMF